MNEYIVTEDQLMSASGYTRRGDLMRHLDKHQIQYNLGKGGMVYTTVFNVAKVEGLFSPPINDQMEIDFV